LFFFKIALDVLFDRIFFPIEKKSEKLKKSKEPKKPKESNTYKSTYLIFLKKLPRKQQIKKQPISKSIYFSSTYKIKPTIGNINYNINYSVDNKKIIFLKNEIENKKLTLKL